jgi:tRNA pseudouridine38-40 synthase
MRYFVRISYRGTRYFGWQRQPEQQSIQEVLEEKMSLILRENISITGCGRTDTGVHARNYYFHFDSETSLPSSFNARLDRFLPVDIAIHEIIPVHETAHARFDATSRTYQYFIGKHKDPFQDQLRWFFHQLDSLDIESMQKAAALLRQYHDFTPFCKTNSSAKTMECRIDHAFWFSDEQGLVFEIKADRFLRGMVRLIVGMCIMVGLGKLSLEEVQKALETKKQLPQSFSVPPDGLFLCKIEYPYI